MALCFAQKREAQKQLGHPVKSPNAFILRTDYTEEEVLDYLEANLSLL